MKLQAFIAAIATGVLSSSGFAAEIKPATVGSAVVKSATPSVSITAPAVTTTISGALNTDKDKFSYAIGWDIGEKLKKTGLDINIGTLMQGLKDVTAGSGGLLTQVQRQEVVQKVQKEFMARKDAELKQMAEKNRREGEAYLIANKAKPGFKTTASGLQYHIVKEGAGLQPSDNDEVVVEYQGKLLNGEIFESSYKVGKPIVAKVADVIAGWKEALKLMKVGSEWEVVIPANLAYGESGVMGGPIGPNQTLIFTIKLVGVNKADAVKTLPAEAKKS